MRPVSRAASLALAALSTTAWAQERPPTPPWSEDAPPQVAPHVPAKPKVDLRFDRYYHVTELHDALRQIAAAYPDLVTVASIGKSVEGRELLVATVTDRTKGEPDAKPAFWCDGNIHGNEVQAGEACLYLVWWLCENRESLPRVRELLEQRTFYVMPSLNPDGRAHWFDAPNTMHSSRGGKRPVDNDRDGRFDEDPPNDLDGDGELLEMRIEDPDGDFLPDPEDPRQMVRVKPGERGKWRLLGTEGIDDDGDGRVNEDGPGGYDPNRDWPADWRGPAEQHGAGPYPLSLPESRAVADFLVSHPNVAGFQSFHNTGGMILRGPGNKDFGAYTEKDDRVLRALAERGEEMLPFYRSMVLWRDLYPVHGGEFNFAYETLGIFAFTNELWNSAQYRGREARGGDRRDERRRFDDDLEWGGQYVDWKPFDHPQFGRIELGGWRKVTGRVPPPFMIQEMLHRNAAFVMFHAAEMPLVKAGEVAVKSVGPSLYEIDATFLNEGMIPTRAHHAAVNHIGNPDVVEVSADGEVGVLSAGVVDPATGRVPEPELRRPYSLRVPGGIPGDGAVRVRFLVRTSVPVTVTYRADKGGAAHLRAALD